MKLFTNNKLVILILCIFLVSGCQRKKKPVEQAPFPVDIYTVKEEAVDYFDEYPGVVSPLNEISIISQVTGSITEIYFTDGQKVKKNQKLYSIDKQQFRALYNQSVANLNAAKANQDKAQKDADRYTFLLEKDAIAKQTVDYALANLQTAKMQVKAAQEDVVNQSAYLRYAEIKSPVDGTIGFSNVEKGALATAGVTVLNTIASNDPIGVDFYLNEKEVPGFMSMLDKANKDSLFSILLPNDSLYPFFGEIYAIDRAIDPQTATLKVRLSFQNPSEILKEGLSCTVKMNVHRTGKKIIIPAKSLVEQMGEYFVFVVSPDHTVKQQKVLTGRTIENNIVIEGGISAGDNIVTDGVQNLRPGAKVKLNK